jgi:hypothetical protein
MHVTVMNIWCLTSLPYDTSLERRPSPPRVSLGPDAPNMHHYAVAVVEVIADSGGKFSYGLDA